MNFSNPFSQEIFPTSLFISPSLQILFGRAYVLSLHVCFMWSNNLIVGPHRSGFGFFGHRVIVGNCKVSIGLFMDSIADTVGFSFHTKKINGKVDLVFESVQVFSYSKTYNHLNLYRLGPTQLEELCIGICEWLYTSSYKFLWIPPV